MVLFLRKKLTDKTPKTMIEYSQPNTHKELHVGHMRNLCLGSALINLHQYAGFEVLSATFPGDMGTHVAKCLWYLKKHNKENAPASRKGAWLGALYSKAHIMLEDQKDKNHKEELTAIINEIESANGPYYELWKETRQWSLEQMQEIYAWAGVHFDYWFWESEVDQESLELVQDYHKKGLFIKDDGAIGIDLKEEKLGFVLLLKSDGTGLYATKDLSLALRKKTLGIQKSIYVVDKRQELHFKQVFSILEKMGQKDTTLLYHLSYDFVELPSGPMSSRAGNIVPIQSLIDQMQLLIEEQYLVKYKDEWNEKEIKDCASIIAAGAIKYGMNRIDSNKKIVFAMKEWLKLDGDSGPYLQYVCARIKSLLSKAKELKEIKGITLKNYSLNPREIAIILKIASFNEVIESCLRQYKTSPLCHYLYEMGKLFNSFYAESPILKEELQEAQDVRILLAQSTYLTMEKGLALLGITLPHKM